MIPEKAQVQNNQRENKEGSTKNRIFELKAKIVKTQSM